VKAPSWKFQSSYHEITKRLLTCFANAILMRFIFLPIIPKHFFAKVTISFVFNFKEGKSQNNEIFWVIKKPPDFSRGFGDEEIARLIIY
jgi:hypothetical protein